SSPLVSDKMSIEYLATEFKYSAFENSIKDILSRYKHIRTVRRDGDCFYRSYMFRLFEELSMKKSKELHDKVVKIVEESKGLSERQGVEWSLYEDLFNSFISEWKFVYQLDPSNTAEYM